MTRVIEPTLTETARTVLERHYLRRGPDGRVIETPGDASVADIRRIYLSAWRAGVKGITVHRDGSRREQVLTIATPVSAAEDHSGGCTAGTSCDY